MRPHRWFCIQLREFWQWEAGRTVELLVGSSSSSVVKNAMRCLVPARALLSLYTFVLHYRKPARSVISLSSSSSFFFCPRREAELLLQPRCKTATRVSLSLRCQAKRSPRISSAFSQDAARSIYCTTRGFRRGALIPANAKMRQATIPQFPNPRTTRLSWISSIIDDKRRRLLPFSLSQLSSERGYNEREREKGYSHFYSQWHDTQKKMCVLYNSRIYNIMKARNHLAAPFLQ